MNGRAVSSDMHRGACLWHDPWYEAVGAGGARATRWRTPQPRRAVENSKKKLIPNVTTRSSAASRSKRCGSPQKTTATGRRYFVRSERRR
jgi:hypothetical protein